MTPQSDLMVLAALDSSKVNALKALLDSMNLGPGVANPNNPIIPFGKLKRLHFARFVILDDTAVADIEEYGGPAPQFPLYLAFLADFDGAQKTFIDELIKIAGPGLVSIFSHCQGFHSGDLRCWMLARQCEPATAYVNCLGRTVQEIRQNEALYIALENYLRSSAQTLAGRSPPEVHALLGEFVHAEEASGRLTLTEPARTPWTWSVFNSLHAIGLPLVLLLLAPFILLYLPVFIVQLRRRETNDPEITPPVNSKHEWILASLEDRNVTNQFTAIGCVKPGLFRRRTLAFLLCLIGYTTRHIYNRHALTRVGSIHFARWVFIDDKRRLFFASNYDGSLDSYMDDFINKVGWGLNLVFGNGVGYPRTNWLILDGAKDEQKFKRFLRRHQLPSQVWYNANPGLTAFDLYRNERIREGIRQPSMTTAQCQEWLNLF